jgi:hypothetical protein
MVNTYDEIFDAALSLPPGLRAMLAEHLFKSLDAENQLNINLDHIDVITTLPLEVV